VLTGAAKSYRNSWIEGDRFVYTLGMSPTGTRVIAYLRVSTSEQAESGAGMDAQRAAITAEVERRGWILMATLEDAGVSGKSRKGRKGLAAALAMLEAGAADALIVSKVDRVARSLLDFCTLTEEAKQGGWSIIALDAAFDQTTPQGRAMTQMLGVFAELEREMISQRTKDGLAAKRVQGVQLGRRVETPERVDARIQRQRAEGMSFGRIANGLNEDAIPTVHGGVQWYAATVRAVLQRQMAAAQ